MKPPAFDYVRADSVEEALAALAEAGGEARVLAGGQSLGPMLNLRLAMPEVVVDIGHIPNLAGVSWEGAAVSVGAGTSQAALLADPALAERQPLLAAAMPWIGHVQTRARGTVCGSLAHADPAAELPLLFAVLGGMATIRSTAGQRDVPADAFFAGMFETALAADEMLVSVRFDAPRPSAGVAFREVAERHGDFAVVAAAAVADGAGVTLGLGGVSDRPVVTRWPGLAAGDAQAAVDALADGLDPQSDPRADADYRRWLVRGVGLETVRQAMERRDAV